jgi:DNA-binding protein H-NS
MHNQIYWSREHRQFLEQERKDAEEERDQAEQERDLAISKYSQVKDQLAKQGITLDEEEISSSYSSCDLDREYVN